MNFQRERMTKELFDEAWPLLERHYQEISGDKDIPLKPDIERYLELDLKEVTRTYTARDSSNVLTGYSVFIVSRNLHYITSVQAIQDVLYINPARRGFVQSQGRNAERRSYDSEDSE